MKIIYFFYNFCKYHEIFVKTYYTIWYYMFFKFCSTKPCIPMKIVYLFLVRKNGSNNGIIQYTMFKSNIENLNIKETIICVSTYKRYYLLNDKEIYEKNKDLSILIMSIKFITIYKSDQFQVFPSICHMILGETEVYSNSYWESAGNFTLVHFPYEYLCINNFTSKTNFTM